MKLLKKSIQLFIITLILTSCSSEDDDIISLIPPSNGDYEKGILITNEGPFSTGTGTISYISEDFNTVDDAIYNDVNESDLGNIVQSMGFSGNVAFIIINNSNKIEVVNRYTFENNATIIEGINNPRYFVDSGDYGYVSNWGDPFDETDDFIAVIDINTFEIIKTIPVGLGPEKLVSFGEFIYVAHQGAYGQNNIVSVINTFTNEIETVIQVGDVPNSMVLFDSDLYVLCGGSPSFTGSETNGSLVKINTITNEPSQTINFDLSEHPSNLTINDAHLLYTLNGAVYNKDISANSLPTTSILDGLFYTMTAKEGMLYATDAGDFASNGTLMVFDLSTNSELQSIEVGIIPGGIYFND